ncbi:hypothetical protein QQS21_001641 [Conoideocrella luteorostrata]|uniref:2EXR domain-containing protein n=1 Tax=Conoideocrella luteorostrata TaxID=1105319 RepID=A0AAJ0CWP3_9HYPO|nr:hypothetical protein QQS21_001641 [Conoideocrella luteorostrata]
MEPVFHLFPRLPYELRALIWTLTVEPRTVPISCWIGDRPAKEVNPSDEYWRRDLSSETHMPEFAKHHATTLPLVLYAASPIKPSIIHACRESRALNLYEKLILEPGSEASFAWVNFDVDTIDIGDYQIFQRFKHCGHKIRRLKLEANMSDEYFSRYGSHELSFFNNLLECFIVTKDPFYFWAGAYEERLQCKPESTFIIDEITGEVKCCADLDQLWEEDQRRISEEWDTDGDGLE